MKRFPKFNNLLFPLFAHASRKREVFVPIILILLSACTEPLDRNQKTEKPLSFSPLKIGDAPGDPPWITDIDIEDIDQDGRLDIVFTEGRLHEVRILYQYEPDAYIEKLASSEVKGPAHLEALDFDGDGDTDLLVASMGVIFPNNSRIGSVVFLEQLQDRSFKKHILIDSVARVTDAQAADLDDDGDLDLVLAQFGYEQGEIRWMENLGNLQFKSHILLQLPGAIHSPTADFDGDGDLDIAALVSQEWEEVHLFENTGQHSFKQRSLYGSTNEDFGSSGISVVDLDQDGDPDILYTNGDTFDYATPGPRPWHGVQWLENQGELSFEYHRIGTFPGAFSPFASDLDGDGDLDVLAVSCFNHWTDEGSVAVTSFLNDGEQNFTELPIAYAPTHLAVVEAADINGDGQVEFVTGSFHAYPPYDQLNRITLWKRD
ncbi:VCBS repeat-containing protein [Pelagicoccus sp. SDUM812005]|uniref:FG-GAP repeat domain-containing protein n=1 Tax=Pelagicoccus sp. SDUM812005 TaxID=3041257 RepID=UPI0028103A11|nr:VCBS repeat-containing protein [Pelagicoccus sp. SDUM812005]MDQ8180340.1 VCBS repeat-containing protein [Pelagicoccus sp. SDUM812005]